MLSQPEFVRELVQKAAERGIHVCLDTSGFGDGDLLEELAAANKKQEELRQTVERQQCYISGLEYALRHMTPTVVVESHEKETKEKPG